MNITRTKIDVRYAETDQMGIVHHANYLIWFEIGRTKFIEELGFSYAKMEQARVLSPVTDVAVSYKKPFKYGDKAEVITWIEKYTGIRVVYGYEIVNAQGDVCVTGTTTHTCVKEESFRPIAMKKYFPDWHSAYENAKKREV
jgi:acyl-CoA thioester hydrolase